jgi:hypothetical protein
VVVSRATRAGRSFVAAMNTAGSARVVQLTGSAEVLLSSAERPVVDAGSVTVPPESTVWLRV